MNRKEFLEQLGLGAAFVLTTACLGGCAKEDFRPTEPIDLTLDLTLLEYEALQQNGGFVVIDNAVVVARTLAGDYVAATRMCSHEGRLQITLRDDEWYCTAHGARYMLDGGGLNNNGSNGLTTYQTSLSGDVLRVFS